MHEEYWDLYLRSPGRPRRRTALRAAADEKFTLGELRELRAALATHDHRRCEYLIEWEEAHTWHPEDSATD